jgi:hypothetical protein
MALPSDCLESSIGSGVSPERHSLNRPLFHGVAALAWGWRLPFVLSLVLIPVALYIHLRIEDTPSFRRLGQLRQEITAKSHAEPSAQLLQKRSSPVLGVVRKFPRQLALATVTIIGIQSQRTS